MGSRADWRRTRHWKAADDMSAPVVFHSRALKVWYRVKGRGWLTQVPLDRDVHDEKFEHLVGKRVLIDGELFECAGVERFAHMPPFLAGEMIGLLVKAAVEG